MNKSRKGTESEHKRNLSFSLRKRKMNEKRKKRGMRKLDFLEKMQRKISFKVDTRLALIPCCGTWYPWKE